MKSTSFKVLLERLKRVDELTLLELLQINAEELVDRFEDRIEELEEQLYAQTEEE